MNEFIDHVNNPWIIKNLSVMDVPVYRVTFIISHVLSLSILYKPTEAMRTFRGQDKGEENKDDSRAPGI